MPRDAGPCSNPRNWHDPMPAIRALLVALDEWVAERREPPTSSAALHSGWDTGDGGRGGLAEDGQSGATGGCE